MVGTNNGRPVKLAICLFRYEIAYTVQIIIFIINCYYIHVHASGAADLINSILILSRLAKM